MLRVTIQIQICYTALHKNYRFHVCGSTSSIHPWFGDGNSIHSSFKCYDLGKAFLLEICSTAAGISKDSITWEILKRWKA
jgi:hypothetical protein